jgi:hypothetical protein
MATTNSTNSTTWTDEDAQAWAALQAKQQASIKAALVPVAAALADLANITATLTAARATLAAVPNTAADFSGAGLRIDRLLNVLTVDGAALVAAAAE